MRVCVCVHYRLNKTGQWKLSLHTQADLKEDKLLWRSRRNTWWSLDDVDNISNVLDIQCRLPKKFWAKTIVLFKSPLQCGRQRFWLTDETPVTCRRKSRQRFFGCTHQKVLILASKLGLIIRKPEKSNLLLKVLLSLQSFMIFRKSIFIT